MGTVIGVRYAIVHKRIASPPPLPLHHEIEHIRYVNNENMIMTQEMPSSTNTFSVPTKVLINESSNPENIIPTISITELKLEKL